MQIIDENNHHNNIIASVIFKTEYCILSLENIVHFFNLLIAFNIVLTNVSTSRGSGCKIAGRTITMNMFHCIFVTLSYEGGG